MKMTQEKTTMTKVEMDDASNAQAEDKRAYVVSVVILAAMLALLVALFAGSAEAMRCDPRVTPDCDPPEDPPTNPSYDPVPGGFSWWMPPRYPSLNDSDVTDFSQNSPWHQPDFVQAQSGFRVNFNGCASKVDRYLADIGEDTNFTYSWSFPGPEGSSTTFEGRSCKASPTYMQQGSYVVKLIIKNAAGATLGTFEQTVTVKDKLIVAIGDSYGSGEGNPDRPQTYDFFGAVTAGPKWADKRCHRSSYAGPAQAARELEYADPHSSVTFVFLACSGANISRYDRDSGSGILGQYVGREYKGTEYEGGDCRLVGTRRIDALVMSAGGNDAGFADVLKVCLNPLDPTRWHCNSDIEQQYLVSERVRQLTDRYEALNQRMNDLGLNVAKDKVYLTEYPIGTRGNAPGGYCGSDPLNTLQPPFFDPLLRHMTWDEAAFITEKMAQPLNQKIEQAAQTHGWTYVGGIDSEFSRPLGEDSHGFCSNTPWVRTMVESAILQGPMHHWLEYSNPLVWEKTTGILHPNTIGHDVYKRRILEAISLGAPSPGPTFAASEPEYAPGRVVVRVTAIDPSGIVSETVSVNATGACQVEGITCTIRRLDGQTLEWTMEVTKEGLHTFDFRATDGDEQESSFVHEVAFLPPAPPIISGPTDGSSDTDSSVTFLGAAEAGTTVSLFEEGNPEPVGSATTDSSNAWSITLSGVAEGQHTYTAKATNISGLTSDASEPVRVTVDTQAPKVTSTVPTSNATGVARGVNVSATFTEAMMGSSVNGTTFKLTKAGTTSLIAAVVSYDPTTKKATLNPNANLQRGAKYKAVVSTGAKDAAGNPLDQDPATSGSQPKQWVFTVRR
jgi:Bacterial Ig-like domain/GDSL-like Lipase/Acylhydrolase family